MKLTLLFKFLRFTLIAIFAFLGFMLSGLGTAEASNVYYLINDSGSCTIYRANTDGSNVETVLNFGGVYSDDLPPMAIDSAHGYLYYLNLNPANKGIYRASITGNMPASPERIFDFNTTYFNSFSFDSHKLKDIALDATRGKIYYSYNSGEKCFIRRINIDGSGDEEVLSDNGVISPSLMDIDEQSGILYFVDANSSPNGIYKADITGNMPINGIKTPVFELGCNSLRDIALDATGGKIYYSMNGDPYHIKRVGTTGSGDQDVLRDDDHISPGKMDIDEQGGVLYYRDANYQGITKGIYKGPITGSMPLNPDAGLGLRQLVLDLGSQASNVTDIALQVNSPPTLAQNNVLTLNENGGETTVSSGMLQATDPEQGASELTFTMDTAPAKGVLQKSGVALSSGSTFTQSDIDGGLITYTPNLNENGSDSFTFTVSDGAGGSIGTTTFSITVNAVNDPPSITANTGLTVDEDSGDATVTSGMLQATDSEQGAAELTFAMSTAPTKGALKKNGGALSSGGTFTQADIDGGLITYTPNLNENGSDSFTFTVSDGAGGSTGSTTFNIIFNAVNDAPTLDAISDLDINEDDGQQTVSLAGITAGDGESQTLTVIATSSDPSLISDPSVFYTSPNATGSLTFTPVADASGTVTISVTVTDDGGTANGGADTFSQTFTVTVNPVNDAPSFTNGPDQDVVVNAGPQSETNWATNISAGPADETGQSVTFSVYSNDNPGLFVVQPEVAPNGTLTYTPAADATGSATITMVLKDDGGTANGGADTAAARSFVIRVCSADGGGTLTTSTGSVAAGQTGITLNFSYLADAGGLNNGAIAITVPDGWSVPETDPADPGYSTAGQGSVSISGRTITITGVNLAGGDSLTVKYGDTTMGGPGATAATTPGTVTWEAQSKSTQTGVLISLGASPAITVVTNVTDTNKSAVVADPTTIPGDGTGTATITVTLKDRYENLISGQNVELTQGSGSSVITPATAVSDNNGRAVFTVHSVRAETVTYTARDISAGVTVARTAEVTFTGGVDVSPTGLNLTEGDNAGYTVVLDSQPVDTVTVSVYGGSQTTVAPASLSFNGTNWNIPRTVTVTAVDDHVRQGARDATITNAVYSSDPYYNNIPADSVTVHIIDNDSPAVSIIHPGGAISVTEGGASDKYEVELTTQPSDSVVMSVYGNSQVILDPAVLTFTPHDWSLSQEVTVTAVDDNVDEGPHTASVTHSVYSSDPDYSGMVVQPLTVHITDNDAPVVSAILNPDAGSFDKNPAGQANVCTTITWNDAAQVTDIKADGTSIGAGSYSVSGNILAIKKEYLATRPTGSLVLTVEFDQGNAATLTINISDTTPPTISNPPTWPAGSTLTAGGTTTSSTTLSWTAAADDVGVTGYRIYKDNTFIQTVAGAVYSCIVTGLSSSTTYTFQVQAGDTGDNWTYGPAVTVRTDSSNGNSGGDDDDGPTTQPVNSTTGSATVDPAAGGTVGLGSDVSLKIPANALQGGADAQVAVQKTESPPPAPSGFMIMGKAYQCTVNGQDHYNFSKPVTLTFTFDPAALAPGEEPAVFYYDEETGQLVNIGGTVSGDTITVTVDHFTRYAVMAGIKPVPVQKPAVTLKDISGHWAEANINKLVATGAISGYPDGTFKPDKVITRAEFTSVLVRDFQLKARDGKVFADTAGHWAQNDISTVVAYGLVTGYTDTKFGPDDPLTREQMAAIIVRAAKLSPVSGEPVFNDSEEISDWAKIVVKTAVKDGIMSGYPDGTFRPQRNATRAEAVTVILGALNK